MVIVLYASAALELFTGIGAMVGSKSAIHEILGMLAIGFSIMTMALAGILSEVTTSRMLQEAARSQSRRALAEAMLKEMQESNRLLRERIAGQAATAPPS